MKYRVRYDPWKKKYYAQIKRNWFLPWISLKYLSDDFYPIKSIYLFDTQQEALNAAIKGIDKIKRRKEIKQKDKKLKKMEYHY